MTRVEIGLSDRLASKGDAFRFEGRRDDQLDFISARSGIRLSLTDVELAEGIAAGDFRLLSAAAPTVRSVPAAAADFFVLAEEKKARARRRLAYLKGLRDRGLTGLGVADVRNGVSEIAAELADNAPPHYTTIWRWTKRASERLTAVHLVDNDAAKGNRTDRLGPEVREITSAVIDCRYLRRERPSIAEVVDLIRGEIVTVNETRITKLKPPSYLSVRNAIARLSPRDVVEARFGKAVSDMKFNPVRRQKSPEAPLDLVEIDHTKADLFVIDDETMLPIGRPWITLGMDRCTRMPFGLYIGFDPPSVHSVMQCLRSGMLPKNYIGRLITEEGWKIKHPWPVFGRPREISVDRGLEFVGHDLAEFGAAAGIDIRFSPSKRPWYKGAIERYLGTLNRRLVHQQRGTTFSNIIERGDYDPASNAVISLRRFQLIVHRWLLDIYACGRHAGISDVPMRLWSELTTRFPVCPIRDVAELEMLYGRVEERRLSRAGIAFQHQQYISDELVAWLSDPDFVRLAGKGDVKFRYDPADLREIRVIDPRTGGCLRVPADDQEYVRGLSIWQHQNIVNYRRRRMEGAIDREGLALAKKEIADWVDAAWADRKRSANSRQKLARYKGIGRFAMAGDSVVTEAQTGSASACAFPDSGPSSEPKLQDDAVWLSSDASIPARAARRRHRAADQSSRHPDPPGRSFLRRLAQDAPTGSTAGESEAYNVYEDLRIHTTKKPQDGR